jgi:hypothetical protein
MKHRAIILTVIFVIFATGCMKKDEKKPMQESQDMGYYEDQSRTNPMNMGTDVNKNDYAKWGKMALKETQKKYPDSQISDYQYDTRRVSPDGTITDWFDFTVDQGMKEHLVKVGVMHTEDDKLIDMKFEERS